MRSHLPAFAAVLACLPLAAPANDLSQSELQARKKLAAAEHTLLVLEKQLEVYDTNHKIEKKRLEIATTRRDRAQAEREAYLANLERTAPKITDADAQVQSVNDTSQTCDASAYVLYHCKGLAKCTFPLNTDDMCKLPGPADDLMLVSVNFQCAGTTDFRNQTFQFAAAQGQLTCF